MSCFSHTKSVALGIVLAACWPTAAVAGEPENPVPRGNPSAWVSTSDYPSEALIQKMEGVSRFLVEITAEGAVDRCTIIDSSGFELLDAKTCELIEGRARFKPARDADGKAIRGTWGSAVRWVIPDDPTVMPAQTVQSFVVGKDGLISDCKTVQKSGNVTSSVPGNCPSHRDIGNITDKNGNPLRIRVTRYSYEVVEVLPD